MLSLRLTCTIQGVGGDVSETGDGPGSYDVDGNVWHLTVSLATFSSAVPLITVSTVGKP